MTGPGTSVPNHPAGAQPSVTLVAATAIVVADMVGLGVFTSLGFQVKDISSPFALMLLWLFGGVVALCRTVTEQVLREPERTVPKALFFGTAIVIALYVLLNLVFLYTTKEGELAGQLDVAIIAGRHIFGDMGGRLVGALICIGLVSTISAMMWIGPRVAMTMGEDLHVFRIFAYRTKQGVPSVAILFQLVIATLLFSTQSFEAVLDFIQLSLTFCSFLTVLGVIKLRITHPDMARPYRAWGYPVTPVFFCAVSLFIMYYLVTHRPVQSLAGLLMVLVGLAIYGLAHARQASVPRAL